MTFIIVDVLLDQTKNLVRGWLLLSIKMALKLIMEIHSQSELFKAVIIYDVISNFEILNNTRIKTWPINVSYFHNNVSKSSP